MCYRAPGQSYTSLTNNRVGQGMKSDNLIYPWPGLLSVTDKNCARKMLLSSDWPTHDLLGHHLKINSYLDTQISETK